MAAAGAVVEGHVELNVSKKHIRHLRLSPGRPGTAPANADSCEPGGAAEHPGPSGWSAQAAAAMLPGGPQHPARRTGRAVAWRCAWQFDSLGLGVVRSSKRSPF